MEKKKQIDIRYIKLENTLKGYLKGKNFHKALEAFNDAKHHHNGFRKDGITPEFQHQVEIALYITTLKEIKYEEETLCAVFLHDIREDYDVEDKVIRDKYGDLVADAVEALTKKFKGMNKTYEKYFHHLALDPIASLVKGADRIHNISSMSGVFSIEKQEKYIYEVKQYFMPMLKTARKNFPSQLMSYYNMTNMLNNMTAALEQVIKAEKELLLINNPKQTDESKKIIKPH